MTLTDASREASHEVSRWTPQVSQVSRPTRPLTCDDDTCDTCDTFSDLAAHTRSIGTGRGNAQDGAHTRMCVTSVTRHGGLR